MTNNAQEYDIAEIRNLLTEAFTAKDLRRFCYDRPTFRPIVDEFAPDHGVADMVDRVIDYCQTHYLWNELLAEVALVRSRHYARFQPHLGKSAPPPATGTAAAVATARAWPAWYWVVGALIVVLLVIVGVWWPGFRPENGPGSQLTETRVTGTAAAPTPFLEFFRVFPSEVQPGTPVSISWHVQNAESVEVRPGGIFRGKPTYAISDRPREDETYELYVNGTPAPIESRLVRYVIPPPGAPEVNDFSAMPSQVIEGVTDKITLSWDTLDASSVDIAGVATDLPPVWNITIDPPAETTEYKLVAENDAGRRSHSIQVFVVIPTPTATLTPAPTPTPIPPTATPDARLTTVAGHTATAQAVKTATAIETATATYLLVNGPMQIAGGTSLEALTDKMIELFKDDRDYKLPLEPEYIETKEGFERFCVENSEIDVVMATGAGRDKDYKEQCDAVERPLVGFEVAVRPVDPKKGWSVPEPLTLYTTLSILRTKPQVAEFIRYYLENAKQVIATYGLDYEAVEEPDRTDSLQRLDALVQP